jgi:hypothetical protein
MPKPNYPWYRPLPPYAPERATYERWAAMSHTTPWANALVTTYFDNHPCDTTQAAYKARGLLPFHYWQGELTRIFTSTLTVTDAFLAVPYLDYYAQKYAGAGRNAISIAAMDVPDQHDIFRAFTTQLGMHWSIFPFTLEDILKRANILKNNANK